MNISAVLARRPGTDLPLAPQPTVYQLPRTEDPEEIFPPCPTGHEYFSYLGQKTQKGAANQAKVDIAHAERLGNVGAKDREGQTLREVSTALMRRMHLGLPARARPCAR